MQKPPFRTSWAILYHIYVQFPGDIRCGQALPPFKVTPRPFEVYAFVLIEGGEAASTEELGYSLEQWQ